MFHCFLKVRDGQIGRGKKHREGKGGKGREERRNHPSTVLLRSAILGLSGQWPREKRRGKERREKEPR